MHLFWIQNMKLELGHWFDPVQHACPVPPHIGPPLLLLPVLLPPPLLPLPEVPQA